MDWSNKQEVLEAMERSGWDLQFATEELRRDRDVILKAVENYSGALEFIADDVFEKFCDDKEVMMTATDGGWGYVILYLSDRLKKDEEVISCIRAGIFDEDELHEFIQEAINVGVTEETLLNAGIDLLDILKALNRETVHIFELDDESFKDLSKDQINAIQQEVRDLKEKIKREEELRMNWETKEVLLRHGDLIVGQKVVTFRKLEKFKEERREDDDSLGLYYFYKIELQDEPNKEYILRECIISGTDEKILPWIFV